MFTLTPVIENEGLATPLTPSALTPPAGQAIGVPDSPTGRGGEQDLVAVATPAELAQTIGAKVFVPIGYPIDQILYRPRPERATVEYTLSFLRETTYLHVLWPAPDPSRYEEYLISQWEGEHWTVSRRETLDLAGKSVRMVLLQEQGVTRPWHQTLLLWQEDGYLLELAGLDTTPSYPRATTETVLQAASSIRGFAPEEIASAPWQMRSPDDRASARPRRYASAEEAARESGLTIYVPSRARVEWVIVAQVEDPPDSGRWSYNPYETTVMLAERAMLTRRASPPDPSRPLLASARSEVLTVNGSPAVLEEQMSAGGSGPRFLALHFTFGGQHFVITAPAGEFDRARLVAIAESLRPVPP
ncbi:MAG TPA: hypothetical protein VNL95_07510 [Dehalococcoidia bacterium]|nr:hypothetical protein [Dehalococcoidia bacterium]